MIPPTVEQLLADGSEDAATRLLADRDSVFLVDWREEDDAIVGYCERILKTGQLRGEIVDVDDDPGFEIYIERGPRRVKVPLVVGPEDRHITLFTLNQLLMPDYEIRVCVDSNGSDTLAFLPLSSADWSKLEARFGNVVRTRFRKIEEHPNLFTEGW